MRIIAHFLFCAFMRLCVLITGRYVPRRRTAHEWAHARRRVWANGHVGEVEEARIGLYRHRQQDFQRLPAVAAGDRPADEADLPAGQLELQPRRPRIALRGRQGQRQVGHPRARRARIPLPRTAEGFCGKARRIGLSRVRRAGDARRRRLRTGRPRLRFRRIAAARDQCRESRHWLRPACLRIGRDARRGRWRILQRWLSRRWRIRRNKVLK